MKQMGYMKAAHFLIGSDQPKIGLHEMAEKEALAMKWNP